MSNEFSDSSETNTALCHKPNILIIMVDQQRYPTVYENQELKAWRKKYLVAEEILKSRGIEFKNHYAGSTACSPSRATLYTGQYPSLHGVSQTDGAAKGAYDPDMYWLDPSTVPTMGDYFRIGGYRTYWQGKWHVSKSDIIVPGTKNAFLTYDPKNGVPLPDREQLYRNANILDYYGFNEWVGPEPHGSNPRNSGASAATGVSGRDVVYSHDTVELIKNLDGEYKTKGGKQDPWLVMCSFVNPHDIAMFGAFTRVSPNFNFRVDPSVPNIPPAPTAAESLYSKPSAQSSYKNVYPHALQPLLDTLFYRKLYYSLQLEVDRQICMVLDAIMKSSLYNNTVIIFTSDHGELLGAHGLFQKWYQAYEEAIHVPLIIHNPILFKEPKTVDMLTSHVDILPTILGITGLNQWAIQERLCNDHTEVHPLVGRNLTPLIFGDLNFKGYDEPIYFMTDDNFTKGLNQVSVTGIPYHAVIQPNSIETVIAALPTGSGGTKQIWKYSRYFDNPQFWSIPGREQQYTYKGPVTTTFNLGCTYDSPLKTQPVAEQYEMYNLTIDPLETSNLTYTPYCKLKGIMNILDGLLQEQCTKKRLYPTSGTVPGKPSC